MTPFDPATGTAGNPIPVGSEPWGIAITLDGKTACVANYGDDTVTPIDLTTNTAGTPIPVTFVVGARFDVAITPDGTTARVVDSFNNEVWPIGTATNPVGTPIPVGNIPIDIAITP